MGPPDGVLLELSTPGLRRVVAKLAGSSVGLGLLGVVLFGVLPDFWSAVGVLPFLASQLLAGLAGGGLREAVRVIRVAANADQLVVTTLFAGVPFRRRAFALREIRGFVVEQAPGISVGRFGANAMGVDLCRLQALKQDVRVNLTPWVDPRKRAELERAARGLAERVDGGRVYQSKATHAIPEGGMLDLLNAFAVLFALGYLVWGASLLVSRLFGVR